MSKERIIQIIHYLDEYIENTGLPFLKAPEANQYLDEKKILKDRPARSGMPLRRLLRDGLIHHAYQDGVTWIIPHSSPGRAKKLQTRNTKSETSGITVEQKAEETRKRYKPEKIRVLMIGESPPAGGTFFYFGNSNLYRYTVDAFFTFFGKIHTTIGAFFEFFVSSGFYLDDLCLEPLNYKNRSERKQLRQEGVSPLSNRIKQYSPDIIICVMKAIEPNVRKSVQLTGHSDIPFYSLPFPANGNQRKYVNEMIKILNVIDE